MTFKELKAAAAAEAPQLDAARTALAQAEADGDAAIALATQTKATNVTAREADFDRETKEGQEANAAYATAVFTAPGHIVVYTDAAPFVIDSSDGAIVTSTIVGNGNDPAPGSEPTPVPVPVPEPEA